MDQTTVFDRLGLGFLGDLLFVRPQHRCKLGQQSLGEAHLSAAFDDPSCNLGAIRQNAVDAPIHQARHRCGFVDRPNKDLFSSRVDSPDQGARGEFSVDGQKIGIDSKRPHFLAGRGALSFLIPSGFNDMIMTCRAIPVRSTNSTTRCSSRWSCP